MNSDCENIYGEVLQSQKDFAYLLLPRAHYIVVSKYIFLDDRDKAGLSCGTSLTSGEFLAELQGRLALSVFRHNAKFHSMPRTNEISGKGNNSTRTASAKAVNSTVSKPIYKVSIRAIGTWAADYKNGVYSSDIYHASNQEEAIGMACEHIKAKFPRHSILADEIKCSLLNPAGL